ncbi:MAG TPA: rod shape-determining protein MreC [Candidatus Sulfotelmatobacter sp.]
MESVFSRYRNLVVLVGVLFLQILGLAVQVKRSSDAQDTRLIRIWAVGAVTPPEKILVAIQNGVGNIWHNYLYLRGVRAENRDLKAQLDRMSLEQVRLREDAAQARRLQSLLAFKEQYITKTVAAQVIGSSGSDLSRGVYLDKGSKDGIQPDMAVITSGGIVGKVLRVYPSTSLVLLINDQSSGVGAVLEKTRLQGVIRGTPAGEVVLERVMSDEEVSPGEPILTSGGDQIFPKGLPVGTIARVGARKDLFLNITIKPSANLDQLEEVLVIVQKQERPSVADDVPRARAADILAQRLPSVPDHPAVPPATAASVSAEANQHSPSPATSKNGDAAAPGAVSSVDSAKAAAARQPVTQNKPKDSAQGTDARQASSAAITTSETNKKPLAPAANSNPASKAPNSPTQAKRSAATAPSSASQPPPDPDTPH